MISSTALSRGPNALVNDLVRKRLLHSIQVRPRSFSSTTSCLSSSSSENSEGGKLSLPYKVESPLAPLGVAAALLQASSSSYNINSDSKTHSASSKPTRRKIFDEFALRGRVALVSGANHGLGLEMAMALAEAGARAVYCVDQGPEPSYEWKATREHLQRLEPLDRPMPSTGEKSKAGGWEPPRLEYISADVRDQALILSIGESIGARECRLDVCVAAAGIPSTHTGCLSYPSSEFRRVLDVNAAGTLFTAQAAGRQMKKFGNGGSIVLVASMSGSITNRGHKWVAYNASKAAVLQMARSMACELARDAIRVNSLSPGYMYTNMSAAELETTPQLLDQWSELTPMGRIGRPDELRGVVTWLASDASSYCTGSDILVAGGHQAW